MITVFTPTYNRATTLKRLYKSLCKQSSKKFEWLIVDDGSNDNTKQLVNEWEHHNNGFEIKYLYKKNGGKHTAVNMGVKMAQYPWFFIVDSDDYLKTDAIEKLLFFTKGVYNNTKFAGVSGTKVYKNGLVIGGRIKNNYGDYIDAKNNDRKRYGLTGDKAELFKTDLLRKYPFPVFGNEKYIDEGAVWNKLAIDGYYIRWYNYPLMVCEYRKDGLTNNKTNNYLHSFKGYTYSTCIQRKAYKGLDKIRSTCQYIKKSYQLGYSNTKIAYCLGCSKFEIICLSFVVKIHDLRF